MLTPLLQAFVAVQAQPPGRVGRYVIASLAAPLVRRIVRPRRRVALRDLAEAGFHMTTTASAALEHLVGTNHHEAEARAALSDIEDRMGSGSDLGTAPQALVVLYSAIRALAPSVVLETGVADGLSTAVMLAAMDRNGHGMLHSVDLSEDVGRIARTGKVDRWRLHVHPHLRGERHLQSLVAELGDIDVFYHDSGHSWLWQTFEYELVAPSVRSLMLSDDIDASYAFIDHCGKRDVRPVALVERVKAFGGYVVDG